MPPRTRAADALAADFEDVHKEITDARTDLAAVSGRVEDVSESVADVRLNVERVRTENAEARAALALALEQGRSETALAIERSRSETAVALEQGRSETTSMENRLIRWIVGTVLVGLGLLFSVLFGVLAANRAEAQEPPQAFTPDPVGSCEGKEPGASCWMEIEDSPGCYMWNPNLATGETVTWSGECSGGLAQGTGSQQWSHPDNEGNPLLSGGEGELRDGKAHGPWSRYFSDGGMAEGSYEHGRPAGPWTNVLPDGTIFEGEWVNGQRRGKWTLTYGDDVGGGFYAAGKQHGRWRLLFAASDDETVRVTAEGTFVAGNRNGLWVTRFDSGTVLERTYRSGVLNGPSTSPSLPTYVTQRASR